MPTNPGFLPNPYGPRTVLFVAFPDMGLLDLTGPQTVFWAATKALAERGEPGYVRHTVSLDGGLVQTAEGVALHTVPLAGFTDVPVDTVVVPGSPSIEQVLARSEPLIEWLRRKAEATRRTASVCSGTFLLAQAGLLHDKRAATHWALCDLLRERFPSIQLDRDALFVREGRVWTSAGVTAGIDLALALVEADHGRDISMKVARELVVFLKRPGGQSQFSELLQSQTQDSADFDELHLWITDHLGSDDLTVETLADRARMSPRNFARVYKQKTGRTPAKAVEVMRLEAARRMLEDSKRNVDQVARMCGFGSEERMRVTFQRNLSISPRDYRKRFAT
ncbi:GlxA family transcriptional regulator [Corallococcus praedator]|uniref:GlxA family transcriptional regulator n=1 Tax=Corallococcus praedator TaxID=2316724 RepID=A0ABX9QRN5_9BACT|nr:MULTISPECIES: GlxA family transcriptional regulator [Corallococcus]RKH36520.1 GlxA family transcriptional regulator [Corallococcus sp. CA031C]RKI17768.1 GlxA family transcriptional regulator [Corallococcus praedator]